jgi:phage terminase small subunit
MDNLTDKQRLFIQSYLANGFNATQAALEAGYSTQTAYAIASENLKKPEIRAAIDAEIDFILANKKELTKKVVDKYADIAFEKKDASDGNRIRACDGLAKYLGMHNSGDVGSGLTELLKGLKEIK